MRNTRLIILLCALGGLAAVIIVMSAVFTVYSADAVCGTSYAENSESYQTMREVGDEVRGAAEKFKYKNIFLFDKNEVIDTVNAEVPRAEAYDVECIFPNKIVVKYRLVTEDLQFSVGGNYVVAGTSGKIVKVNAYDATDPGGGHYSESLISVIPYAAPEGKNVCEYVYADSDCYDMRALAVIVGLPDVLVDPSGLRKFEKAAYASIDLSGKSTVVIKMRNGVAFRLLGGTNKLEEKVRSMISWYVFADDAKTMRGVATISDIDPEDVAYSPNAVL